MCCCLVLAGLAIRFSALNPLGATTNLFTSATCAVTIVALIMYSFWASAQALIMGWS